jgi:diaminopimelate decarboxylase
MDHFPRINGELHAHDIPCSRLAEEFDTPLFVYSRTAIESAWQEFSDALQGRAHLICYAVKANSNLAVLNVLARLGSGFDIVSEGEMQRVLAAGGDPSKIVFSGVGKTAKEMEAALKLGIRCFNVESTSELERLAEIAAANGVVAPVSLRINPDVDAQTHPYISTGLKENKFGIAAPVAMQAYRFAADHDALEVHGIDCHIGSQLTSIEPYQDAVDRLLQMVDELAAEGINIKHLDIGGGQGIRYADESPLNIKQWADCVIGAVGERDLEILVEPGRYIAGQAGLLLTRIEYVKENEGKHFAVVDAAMNDLIRPALYSAWQDIVEVSPADTQAQSYDIVGPVCESADFLGKERSLSIEQGDLLAVMSAGAYGFVMSSNYNTRPRAAEVLVSGNNALLARERETVESLFSGEHIPAS